MSVRGSSPVHVPTGQDPISISRDVAGDAETLAEAAPGGLEGSREADAVGVDSVVRLPEGIVGEEVPVDLLAWVFGAQHHAILAPVGLRLVARARSHSRQRAASSVAGNRGR